MDDFEKYLNKKLKNSSFRKEWEESDTEYQIIKAMMQARIDSGISQKQLSERSGINQSNISRIERGDGNPSIETLDRIAKAMGKKLVISFS